jgi:glucose/arabinose dehydrogenase
MWNRLGALFVLSMAGWLVAGLALGGQAQSQEIDSDRSPDQSIDRRIISAVTPTISLQVFASGLDQPTDISHAGDERLFVVEKDGRIQILSANGSLATQPFLDINGRVGSSASERGLLGLAFHPDYASNGYFYVNYTNNSGDTHISRFQVTPGDANQADPDSEQLVLAIDQDFSNHNGGGLVFGPDGYLYIGMGDGGDGGDPNDRAQSGNSLLGKMLRIDVNAGAQLYLIPPDNPFVNDPNVRNEIWALGLRNPWRFSFDRLTGDMFNADVGQGAWEEINFQPASSNGGENYGWRCYEGNADFNLSGCGPAGTYVFPIHEYGHGPNCSVTGGYVYRGNTYPIMWGHYFFADHCSGTLWSLLSDGQGGWQHFTLGNVPGGPSTFGENSAGELFVAGLSNGTIYQVVETTPIIPNVGVSLIKTVSSQASDCTTPGSGSLMLPGTAIFSETVVTYCYYMQNIGALTLTHHTLMDDQLGVLLNDVAFTLPPGMVFTHTQQAVISQTVTNVATWWADDGSITLTGSAVATVTFLSPPLNNHIFLPVVFK